MRGVIPALLLSLLVYPGAGQAYLRRWPKAALFGIAFTVFGLGAVRYLGSGISTGMSLLMNPNGDLDPAPMVNTMRQALPYLILSATVYLAAAVDAFKTVQQANQPAGQTPMDGR